MPKHVIKMLYNAIQCYKMKSEPVLKQKPGEVILFNNFARVLRAGKASRKVKFWLKARDAGLGLITDVKGRGKHLNLAFQFPELRWHITNPLILTSIITESGC